MSKRWILVPAAVALAVAAPSALAQSNSSDRPARDRSAQSARTARQDGEVGRPQSRGQAVRRADPRPDAAQSGPSSGTRDRTTSRGAQPKNSPSSGTRGYTTSRGAPPERTTSSGTRGYTTSNGAPPERPPSAATRGYATSRPAPPPARNQWNGRGSGGYGGYGHVPYGSYNRDAWRGRVHFGLGLSIFAGNPFHFRFDYGWRPAFAYHYPMVPTLVYGGMSFTLDPYYTEVYIDGQFVGVSSDFGGQPVPVAAGFHRIELYAPGFVPVTFDIRVFPGQVVPYHGTLYPAY